MVKITEVHPQTAEYLTKKFRGYRVKYSVFGAERGKTYFICCPRCSAVWAALRVTLRRSKSVKRKIVVVCPPCDTIATVDPYHKNRCPRIRPHTKYK